MIAMDALPADVCVLTVPATADNADMCLLGFQVFGNDAERAAADAWATAHGLSSKLITDNRIGPEQMILLRGTTTRADLADFYAAYRGGKFGKAKVSVIISPKATAADGLDLQTEVQSTNISAVKMPAQ